MMIKFDFDFEQFLYIYNHPFHSISRQSRNLIKPFLLPKKLREISRKKNANNIVSNDNNACRTIILRRIKEKRKKGKRKKGAKKTILVERIRIKIRGWKKKKKKRENREGRRVETLTSSWSSLWRARFLGKAGTLLTVKPLRSLSSLRAPSAFRLSFRLARLKLIPCSLKLRCLLSTVFPRALARRLLYSSLRRMNFCSPGPSSLLDASFEESESISTDEFETTLIVDIFRTCPSSTPFSSAFLSIWCFIKRKNLSLSFSFLHFLYASSSSILPFFLFLSLLRGSKKISNSSLFFFLSLSSSPLRAFSKLPPSRRGGVK